jgi:hypothetical protein
MVGSSTLMRGSAIGFAGSAMVSPMPISSAPRCGRSRRAGVLHLHALQAVVRVQADDLRRHDAALLADHGDRVGLVQDAGGDPADREPADVVVVVEVVDEHLHVGAVALRGGRDVREDRVEERLQRVGRERPLHGMGGPALAGDRVDHREVDLVLVRAEIDVERVDEVQHLLRAGVLPVYLVHDEDRREAEREGLREDEARLRQRPLRGVDEEEHAIDEPQRALDLAAEVRVAGGVDDVDLHAAVGDRGVLREDGDPLLPLEVVRVHDALDELLVRAEHAGLAQHEVDEGGLAVVDVRDDGDVAYLLAGSHSVPSDTKGRNV